MVCDVIYAILNYTPPLCDQLPSDVGGVGGACECGWYTITTTCVCGGWLVEEFFSGQSAILFFDKLP